MSRPRHRIWEQWRGLIFRAERLDVDPGTVAAGEQPAVIRSYHSQYTASARDVKGQCNDMLPVTECRLQHPFRPVTESVVLTGPYPSPYGPS
jgi:hypothetical protein